LAMFSKKKKDDKAAATPAAGAPETLSSEPSGADASALDSIPTPSANPTGDAPPIGLGGGLSGGLTGSHKTGKPNIAASRLGGRPPAKPSAPAPAYTPPPPPPPTAPLSTPASPPIGSSNMLPGELEMSNSATNMRPLADASGADIIGGVAGGDGKDPSKNPYKLNPLFDIILPVGMSVVLCGGFAMTTKIRKDKHDIYGFTKEEQETVVKDKSIASEQLITEVNKMEPLKLLAAGDTAAALAAAKTMGADAVKQANSSNEIQEQSKAVRGLLCSGMVMSRVGSKAEKDQGLSYLARAEEIATYSKYVRILNARELVRNRRDDLATGEYQKIISMFKEPWTAPHKELGMLYMRTNDGQKAVDELSELVKVDPNDPTIARQLGLAMAQAGDQEEGFKEFQKGFQREQDVLTYPAAVKGLVEAHGGLLEATYSDIKKQADKNPGDIKLQLDLARLEIATGRLKDARDRMEKARKTYELNPEVHEVMSEIMVRQNQPTSGYDEFRGAAQNLHLMQ
jgi:Flp pilus assembly protein TadD